ncbi:PapB/FocB family fimbrial expression transcriptional regulator [Citrobacter braakii]|uniref:PapB/FocB family fimbrial expression transcriptional regulator n=1 Tax=Citrobacter braakii TaxID=57706 RepID=UPI002B39B209|nr:PapB/FocB family fimbrial expression transcriptional regulator [Citrobacter braakii]MEB2723312.1 PapB/FocB family fimbrial expression transcriptional regulator [Citrobacter braakii]
MNKSCTALIIKLYPGKVPEQYFRKLTDISSIRSGKVIKALHDHFVRGKTRTSVCNEYSVCQGYLSVKIRELHSLNCKVNELVGELRELSDIQ